MITIIKLDPQGRETIRYSGEILHSLPHGIVITATWTLPDHNLGYTCFETGDQFVEYYYSDRWFNIFAISTPAGDLKGWYCNITEPAHIAVDTITQVDLYLDLWVTPTGHTRLLDEDEFAATDLLTITQRQSALQGLDILQHMIDQRQEVFATIKN
jgi:protein associated with RNAse G/E